MWNEEKTSPGSISLLASYKQYTTHTVNFIEKGEADTAIVLDSINMLFRHEDKIADKLHMNNKYICMVI